MVRAILAGAAVRLLGIGPWSVLAGLNLRVATSISWACIVEVVYLAAFCAHLSGVGPPSSASIIRRRCLRAHTMPPRVFCWAMFAGNALAAALVAFAVFGWMLVRIPASQAEEFAHLESYSPQVLLPLLLTGAIVTGLIEDVAFRGYMQVPLEERYGPRVAIGIVAVVFTLAHFPPPLAAPGFLLGAIGWGMLVYLSNSIIPSAISHSLADAAVWIWIGRNRASVERLLEASILDGDPGKPTAAAITFLALTSALAVFAVLRSPPGNEPE